MTDTVPQTTSIADVESLLHRMQQMRQRALADGGGRSGRVDPLDAKEAAAFEQWRRVRPERLAAATVESISASANPNLGSDIAEALLDWVESPTANVVLAGGVGTGKSHTAVALLHGAATHHHLHVQFVPAGRLFLEIRNGARTPGQLGPSEPYMKAPVLVLDDVGHARADLTDFQEEVLYDLFSERWFRNVPTIVTTNLNLDGNAGLRRYLGERIADRLFGDCLEIEIGGRSLRSGGARR